MRIKGELFNATTAFLQCNYIWSYNGFVWDEEKNRANIRKHGFDFVDAEEMFRGVLIVDADTRNDYGESRWTALGTVGGRVAHVVFAEGDLETIRIISLRKATSRERKEFEKAVKDRLEAN